MTDKAIGTVYYISPEQASGRLIDPRSDLYSLGAMLYEMVTGQLPFYAESSVSVVLMQVNDNPVPPGELNPSLPQGLEQLILCAMEKDPEYRYQSAAEMMRCVMQLRQRPDTVFPSRKPVEEDEDVYRGRKKVRPENNTHRKRRRGSYSMFPVILGVALSFMIVMGVAIFYVLNQLIIAESDEDYLTIEVENFVGMLYSDALLEQMEHAKHYNIEVDSVYDADAPENTIIAQEPALGTSRKVSEKHEQKCTVKLTVSLGAQTFKLADLTGQEYRQAELLLSRMGLLCDIVEEYHDTALDGYVYKMDPPAGDTVTSGDTVTLYVSKGQKIEYVTVPNFLGLTRDEATKTLIENDLALGKVKYVVSDQPIGTILSQSKPEFASVPKSATKIDFTVSGGPDYEPPKVGNETETEAAEDPAQNDNGGAA